MRDDPESTESAEDGYSAAAADRLRDIADGLATRVGAGLTNFVGNLTRPIPLSQKLWGGLLKRSLYHYHKATGGDRLGLEAKPSGQLEFTPVKWQSAEEVESDQKPGWSAKGRDKVWRATTLGQSGPRIGKTPVIPLDTESWRATSILEARVAEAVDLGDTRPLYHDPDGQLEAEIVYQTSGAAGGDQQAVTDGGQANVTNVERAYQPGEMPIFDDMIIDLGSDEYDGQAVSWLKAKELMASTTTQEEMANQEARGQIAGRSRDDWMAFAKRIFLYAALVALGGLIGPEVVAAVLGGGGGGGGGGIIPLMAGVV